jgi:hypothetical protein
VKNRRQPIRPRGRRRAPTQIAAREFFTGSPQIGRPYLRQAHSLTAIGFAPNQYPQQTCVPPRKRGGRPRVFEEALIEAAKHDLKQALDRKPNGRLWQQKWAVSHVIDFLRRNGADIDDKQARTISRWIVQPVLDQARVVRRR